MSLSYYMDVHVPAAISRALQIRGIDVLTAQSDGTTRMPDAQLLRRARELGRVLFTRDEDFLAETAECQRLGESFAGVIYAHQTPRDDWTVRAGPRTPRTVLRDRGVREPA